jgi:hypothetical protein
MMRTSAANPMHLWHETDGRGGRLLPIDRLGQQLGGHSLECKKRQLPSVSKQWDAAASRHPFFLTATKLMRYFFPRVPGPFISTRTASNGLFSRFVGVWMPAGVHDEVPALAVATIVFPLPSSILMRPSVR